MAEAKIQGAWKIRYIFLILSLLGVILLFIAEPVAYSKRSEQILNLQGHTIQENSSITIYEAYAFGFTLEKNQKMVIEFSCNYINSTVTMKIIGNGTYQSAKAANTTNGPTLLVGKQFVNIEEVYGSYPGVTYGTSHTLTNDGYKKVEFVGNQRVNIPGEYVILVYGDNPSTVATETQVQFNLVVTRIVDTTGVKNTYLLFGWILLILGVALFILFSFPEISNRVKIPEMKKKVPRSESAPNESNPGVSVEEAKEKPKEENDAIDTPQGEKEPSKKKKKGKNTENVENEGGNEL